ncbi:MAG TPA: 50S ribosomal protein L11 [Candidatus Saccharimonadales bacterium]|nr:50S ribosomal protein L11 [Candidatus Saccharimonadales bacterium]
MAAIKPVKAKVKFRVPAGKATPAPPVGSSLGAHGVNMMEFINAFNDATRGLGDVIVPVQITIYEDRTFTFVTKTPPAALLIRQTAGIDKGSGVPHKDKVGKLTKAQVAEIAAVKMPDLSANDAAAAFKVIAGTARSMGVEVEA